MVENQLRPNKITNPEILNIFLGIEKEFFLNRDTKNIAYSDADINIIQKRGYLKNLQIAQLIQYSNINKRDKVLHIGALTGYVTSILSMLSNQVIAIESDEKLFKQLKFNINKLQLRNIEFYKNELYSGFISKMPYDLIFIDNPLVNLSSNIINQLSPSLGRVIMIEKIQGNLGKAIRITKSNQHYNKEVLFDVFSNFELYENKEEFVF